MKSYFISGLGALEKLLKKCVFIIENACSKISVEFFSLQNGVYASFQTWLLKTRFMGKIVAFYNITGIRTWSTEVQQSNWLVTVVENWIDHAVKKHVLKTEDNDLNFGLLSFRHLEMFWHTQKNIRNTQPSLRVLKLSFRVSKLFCGSRS